MSVADVWCKSTELIAAFWLCASLFIVLKWSFETLKSWSACLHSNFLNTLLLKVFYTSCLNTLNSCGYAFPLCVCVCVSCVIVCVHVFVCICFYETNSQSSNILPCRHCLQRQLPEAPCLFPAISLFHSSDNGILFMRGHLWICPKHDACSLVFQHSVSIYQLGLLKVKFAAFQSAFYCYSVDSISKLVMGIIFLCYMHQDMVLFYLLAKVCCME